MKVINILLVSAYFPPMVGGIPTLLDILIRNMGNSGVTFYLLTATKEPYSYDNCVFLNSDSYAELRKLTQTYVDVPYANWTLHKKAIDEAIWNLAGQLKDYPIDAVLAHTETYACSLLANQLSVPCIPVIHGVFPPEDELKNSGQHVVQHYARIREGIANMNCSTVYVSDYTKNWWDKERVFQQKTNIIYNPMDFNIFTPRDTTECNKLRSRLRIPDDAKIVCYPQRPERLGVEILFRCMENVIENNPDIYFLVCGCDNVDRIQKFIRSEGLEKNVRYGWFALEEMPLVYSMSDLTVLPARDGFGYPAFESLACGTRLVAAQDSAFAALLQNNANVTFFQNNDIEDMVAAISTEIMSEHPSKKTDLLSQGIHDLLDPLQVSNRYLSVIQNVIRESKM